MGLRLTKSVCKPVKVCFLKRLVEKLIPSLLTKTSRNGSELFSYIF